MNIIRMREMKEHQESQASELHGREIGKEFLYEEKREINEERGPEYQQHVGCP